jgi:hypothetical protein
MVGFDPETYDLSDEEVQQDAISISMTLLREIPVL